ncbi:MAG: NADPH-dependent 7-cyano-7-deazaguanine reductase QueF [Elusimicrobia bacterium]|nr:NADPH-dependent 7-cyano-7-deazaguanine reductase QueF [Elusimicrobiota bacterium]
MKREKTYFDCSASGLEVKLPEIEIWKNQFSDYEIIIEFPEFTSVCPLTGLPDFGTIIIKYIPDRFCVEMKSLKLYLNAYRNIGIFQENAVNRILKDFVKSVKPRKVQVTGVFRPRGGMNSTITAVYKKRKSTK